MNSPSVVGSSEARHFATWIIVAGATAGVMLRPFRWPEYLWAAGGAILLVATRLVSPGEAWTGIRKGFDVYLFLLGMMGVAEAARREGLFAWLAGAAVRAGRGSAARLFLLIYAVGAAVTIVLSNDATAVVLTPAVFAATKAAGADPLPYLFVCATVANAASFALPISNPANLVVFAGHTPPLGAWLARFGLSSVLSIAATYAVMRWSQRRHLASPIATARDGFVGLPRSGVVVAAGIGVTAVVLLACSASGVALGTPTFLAAGGIVLVVLALKRESPRALLGGVAWSVVPLVAGLFVLAEALDATGAVAGLGHALRALAARGDREAGWVAGTAVAVTCNLLNNLPAGLLAGAAIADAHSSGKVTAAVLVGVDLGPNLSVTGSLATLLWLVAVRREGADVGAWAFLKLGALAMPPALLTALAALLLTP